MATFDAYIDVADGERDIDEDDTVLVEEVFVGSLSMVRQRGGGRHWPPLQLWRTLHHHHHGDCEDNIGKRINIQN